MGAVCTKLRGPSPRDVAATKIQAQWRGVLGRRYVSILVFGF